MLLVLHSLTVADAVWSFCEFGMSHQKLGLTHHLKYSEEEIRDKTSKVTELLEEDKSSNPDLLSDAQWVCQGEDWIENSF